MTYPWLLPNWSPIWLSSTQLRTFKNKILFILSGGVFPILICQVVLRDFHCHVFIPTAISMTWHIHTWMDGWVCFQQRKSYHMLIDHRQPATCTALCELWEHVARHTDKKTTHKWKPQVLASHQAEERKSAARKRILGNLKVNILQTNILSRLPGTLQFCQNMIAALVLNGFI